MTPEKHIKRRKTKGAMKPKEQKRALILAIILGIFAISFGIYQLYSGLTGPFNLSKLANLANEQTNISSEQEQLIADLHNKDTDKDGLSDYDELYVYHTSPYLADSDSDGINDKQEIQNGTDPNCPQGKVCQQATTANTNANTNAASNTNLISLDLNAAGTPDVSSLRQALIDAGAPASDVNSLSDEQLLEMYQEVMNEQAGGTTNLNSAANTNTTTSNTNSSTNTNTASNTNSAVTIQTLQNLTPAQIRDFLIQNGVDEATLNQVDDATLKSIFLQALSQQTQ